MSAQFDSIAISASVPVSTPTAPQRRESKSSPLNETYFEWGLKVLDNFEHAASLTELVKITNFIELSIGRASSSEAGSELASAALLFKPSSKFTKLQSQFLLALLYRQKVICIKKKSSFQNACNYCQYALTELKCCLKNSSPDLIAQVQFVLGEIYFLLGEITFNNNNMDAHAIKHYEAARIHWIAAIHHSKPEDAINKMATAKSDELEQVLSATRAKQKILMGSLEEAGLEGPSSQSSCACVII